MTTVLELLLVLGFMVLVHEFGHFAVAKWCGVRVETFAIGFGKRVVGFRRGETDYQINALPLGGYVKMAGEIPGEEVSNDPGELNNHPRWQRMLIALAGPFSNFVLAFVLMAAVYMVHNEVNEYISGAAVTDYISPGSAVAKTGIRSGDTIVRFDSVESRTSASEDDVAGFKGVAHACFVGGSRVVGDGPGAAVDEEDGGMFGRGRHGDMVEHCAGWLDFAGSYESPSDSIH